MSLDVWLQLPSAKSDSETGSGIFVRENGQTREITREEWDEKHPGMEPVVLTKSDEDEDLFHANITHNLNKMAARAGIYDCLWRPDESGLTHAYQLIPLLEAGLVRLRSERSAYEELNPENGWGSYEGFVPWVAEYLAACKKWPTAEVKVWR